MFALTCGVALSLLGAVVWLALHLHFEAQDRRTLHAHLGQARVLLTRVDNTGALAALPQQLQAQFGNRTELAVRVQGAWQQLLYEQVPQAQMPQALLERPSLSPPAPLLSWQAEDGVRWRGSALRISLPLDGAAPLTVAMALDVQQRQAFALSLGRVILAYVLLATLACAALGAWVQRRAGPTRTRAGRV